MIGRYVLAAIAVGASTIAACVMATISLSRPRTPHGSQPPCMEEHHRPGPATHQRIMMILAFTATLAAVLQLLLRMT